jgi:hypothetical protein
MICCYFELLLLRKKEPDKNSYNCSDDEREIGRGNAKQPFSE